jgi:hypothetical protein
MVAFHLADDTDWIQEQHVFRREKILLTEISSIDQVPFISAR